MQTYYITSNSLAHARNFKYIKREPDGKGGWRYYYDVKKHGADIRKRVEDKTGITARNKMDKAKYDAYVAEWKADRMHNKAVSAKKNYEFGMQLRREVREKQKAGINTRFVGSGPNHQKDGEEYRDASIAYNKAKKEHAAAEQAYNKAKKEYWKNEYREYFNE